MLEFPMTFLSRSFCFFLVMSILPSISGASAQNVPRLYTNGASCGAIKAAIRKNGKIVLRFKKPRSSRVTYGLFFKSPSGCTGHEEAVSASVPSSGGACKVKFQCVPRMDQEEESSLDPIIVVAPVVAPVVVTPNNDGCGGCES